MLPKVIKKTITLSDGREISIETGKLARQADGSVVVRMGDTMLLATVVGKSEASEGQDFLPLSVDYQEKFASTGRIPGGFLRREGRLSDHEILVSRLVDRAMRPLFPDDYYFDTQINIFLISGDPKAVPDALAAFGASTALTISSIPFNGPISEVRVARVNGELVVNPSMEGREQADLDIIVGATIDNITMVEGEMDEANEDDLLEALKLAHSIIKEQCHAQLELAKELNVVKREFTPPAGDEDLYKMLHEKYYHRFYEVAGRSLTNKNERRDYFKAIKEEYTASLPEDPEPDIKLIEKYFGKIEKEACRNLMLNESKRLDGRKGNEIRQIWGEVDYLPSAHGSALFTRGETQSLTTVTLGTKLDEQIIDQAMTSGTSKFMLHYNFPGFSTGEVKPNRGPGRREIGHGNLASRAIRKVLPGNDDNPYTIRIVSDILESNGSSSMATVCAGVLALMDAGIKIKNPVSGIAMGMISDGQTGKYAILSDILGDEDHLGDMDFKVAGTSKGITAVQMDIKVDGLSYDVLKEALIQAREGRIHILGEMAKILDKSREDLKPHAPRSVRIKIEKDQIGAVIGPGGKVVQDIQNTTGATVIIEEVAGGGEVTVFSTNKESMEAAVARIKQIVAVAEVGETYTGKVKSVMPFGAFVEFLPGKDGLLHISEIKWERLEKMDGVLEIGEEIPVKLIGVDKKTGKYRLSRKALLPKPEEKNS
jgi:polyribonucleotide nucleotidyltransferase